MTAIGAATIEKYDVWGSQRANRVLFTFSSNVAAGGDVITAKQCGMSVIKEVLFQQPQANYVEFNPTDSKLKLFAADGTTEATGDQHTKTVRATVVGDW